MSITSPSLKASVVCAFTLALVLLVFCLGPKSMGGSGSPDFIEPSLVAADLFLEAETRSDPVQSHRGESKPPTPQPSSSDLISDAKGRSGKPGADSNPLTDASRPLTSAAIEPFNPEVSRDSQRRRIRLPDPKSRRPGSSPMISFDWGIGLITRLVQADLARLVARTPYPGRCLLITPHSGQWMVSDFVEDVPLGGLALPIESQVEGVGNLFKAVESTAGRPVPLFLHLSLKLEQSMVSDQARALMLASLSADQVAVTAGTIQWQKNRPNYVVDEFILPGGEHRIVNTQ